METSKVVSKVVWMVAKKVVWMVAKKVELWAGNSVGAMVVWLVDWTAELMVEMLVV